ncbi:hypothetical protein [Peribacillus sp. SCS-155]|uniref:hypothetical protein n=1 Tax=Peribacillus sedimenti TaxID=3115297 RepID=UPI003906D21C
MAFLPTQINIRHIKINSTEHAGSVSFGPVSQINKNISGKKNQPFGQQHADFTMVITPAHMILDQELMDSASEKEN